MNDRTVRLEFCITQGMWHGHVGADDFWSPSLSAARATIARHHPDATNEVMAVEPEFDRLRHEPESVRDLVAYALAEEIPLSCADLAELTGTTYGVITELIAELDGS